MQTGRKLYTLCVLGVTVLLSLYLSAGFLIAASTRISENVLYSLQPSAERAFSYGSRYFDVDDARSYDLGRARYFFNEAVQHDPKYPYAQHQLARVSFLESDFDTAVAHINNEIETYGREHVNSYYVRGLIEGYRENFDDAAKDFEIFLRAEPTNWAAINDYAWVLMKSGRYEEALVSLDWGLIHWPENPWLHNSRATALNELGQLQEAYVAIEHAEKTVIGVTEEEWARAYPGNDPLIASAGVDSFREAVSKNMHTILLSAQRN